jgi:hypothetical protein
VRLFSKPVATFCSTLSATTSSAASSRRHDKRRRAHINGLADRVIAIKAWQDLSIAEDLKAAEAGPSAGDAFLADASGPNVVAKIARYQSALMNDLRKALKMLSESQEGHVEQASE